MLTDSTVQPKELDAAPILSSKASLKQQEGFSLIELIVVITIISLLAGTVVIKLAGTSYDAKKTRVKSDFRTITDACEMYQLKFGRYPESMEDLMNPGEGPDGETLDPYFSKKALDPWGREYIFEVGDSGEPLLITYGADGNEGSGANREDKDLSNSDEGN